VDHHDGMTQPSEESRFQQLPEPPRPEDYVETVDTGQFPVRDEETEVRERFLREPGGG